VTDPTDAKAWLYGGMVAGGVEVLAAYSVLIRSMLVMDGATNDELETLMAALSQDVHDHAVAGTKTFETQFNRQGTALTSEERRAVEVLAQLLEDGKEGKALAPTQEQWRFAMRTSEPLAHVVEGVPDMAHMRQLIDAIGSNRLIVDEFAGKEAATDQKKLMRYTLTIYGERVLERIKNPLSNEELRVLGELQEIESLPRNERGNVRRGKLPRTALIRRIKGDGEQVLGTLAHLQTLGYVKETKTDTVDMRTNAAGNRENSTTSYKLTLDGKEQLQIAKLLGPTNAPEVAVEQVGEFTL
jgi:hypothetical protein